MRDTIDMAREAGADTLMYWDTEKLKRFEALVRADEREETNRRANASWALSCIRSSEEYKMGNASFIEAAEDVEQGETK